MEAVIKKPLFSSCGIVLVIACLTIALVLDYAHGFVTPPPPPPQEAQYSDTYDNFIDMLVMCSGNTIDKAVIISKEDGTPLTNHETYGLSMTVSEGRDIAEAFKLHDFTRFRTQGVTVGGATYATFLDLPGNPFTVVAGSMEDALAGTAIITTAPPLPYILVAHCVEADSRPQCLEAMKTVIHLLVSVNNAGHHHLHGPPHQEDEEEEDEEEEDEEENAAAK